MPSRTIWSSSTSRSRRGRGRSERFKGSRSSSKSRSKLQLSRLNRWEWLRKKSWLSLFPRNKHLNQWLRYSLLRVKPINHQKMLHPLLSSRLRLKVWEGLQQTSMIAMSWAKIAIIAASLVMTMKRTKEKIPLLRWKLSWSSNRQESFLLQRGLQCNRQASLMTQWWCQHINSSSRCIKPLSTSACTTLMRSSTLLSIKPTVTWEESLQNRSYMIHWKRRRLRQDHKRRWSSYHQAHFWECGRVPLSWQEKRSLSVSCTQCKTFAASSPSQISQVCCSSKVAHRSKMLWLTFNASKETNGYLRDGWLEKVLLTKIIMIASQDSLMSLTTSKSQLCLVSTAALIFTLFLSLRRLVSFAKRWELTQRLASDKTHTLILPSRLRKAKTKMTSSHWKRKLISMLSSARSSNHSFSKSPLLFLTFNIRKSTTLIPDVLKYGLELSSLTS